MFNINSVLSNSDLSISELAELPDPIRIGVRTSAELFGKIKYKSGDDQEISGWCKEFGEKLKKNTSGTNFTRSIQYFSIANDHLGTGFERYNGLRPSRKKVIQENSNKTNQEKFKIYKPKIDIECGANTKFKLEEISEDDYFKRSEESSSDEDFWKYNINFDNPKEDTYEPYTAQVKLLLHKDLFAELESLKKNNPDEYDKKLHSISIAVVTDTTTFDEFEKLNNQSGKYNHKPLDNRYEALKSIDLEATTKLIQDPTYDAYASDLPILQTILLQGFIENYRIFPPEDPEDKESLPNISPQEYGIAFYSKSKYAQTIKKAIEFTKRKDNQDLDKYINIKQDNIDNKIRLLQDNFSNISPPDPPGNVNLWLWIQIIVFLIITIIVVTFIFRNPNYRDKFMYGIITIILTLFAIWGKEIVITLVELFR